MKTTKITCDFCGIDLTRSGRISERRFVLYSEAIPQESTGLAYAVQVKIEQDRHFCRLTCLRDWALGQIKGNDGI